MARKHRKRNSPPSLVVVAIEAALPEWRFWVTFNCANQGLELPQDKDEFLRVLRVELNNNDYPSIYVETAYNQLQALTRMTMPQRQMIKKLVKLEPKGWKIIRVGRRYRLYLEINEGQRHIRFMPWKRRKAYGGH